MDFENSDPIADESKPLESSNAEEPFSAESKQTVVPLEEMTGVDVDHSEEITATAETMPQSQEMDKQNTEIIKCVQNEETAALFDSQEDTTDGDTAILKSLGELSEKVDTLNMLFSERIKYTEHEAKIVDQMHKELQKYKEDMYSQLIRPVLLDIIEIRDSILRVATAYLNKPEGEQDIPNKTFVGYCLDIQDILEKNGIEIYKSNPFDVFVPIKQRVIKKVPTVEAELHGKIAESLSYGYNYNGRPISAEKVAVYFYEKPSQIA